MNKRTLLAVILLGLTLIACNSTDAKPPTDSPTILLFVSDPAGETTFPPGQQATISWRVHNATTVTVTSDDPTLSIPGSTSHEGSFTHEFTRTTVFTVTADDAINETLTISITDDNADPPGDDPGGDGETPTPDPNESTLELVHLKLTNGGPPAEATLSAEHLSDSLAHLTDNYSWALFKSAGGGWLETATESPSNELTHTFTITEPGDYRVSLAHTELPDSIDSETFTVPAGEVALNVVPFAPGEHTTTIHINHNADWELAIPSWLHTDESLFGTGTTQIEVTLPTSTEPGAYNGEIILTTTTPGAYNPDIRDRIDFAFPRLAGRVTTPLSAESSTATHQQTQVSTSSLPAPRPSRTFTNTPGELVFLFNSNTEEAVKIFEAQPEVLGVILLKSLNMILVNTENMQATATAGQAIPGYQFVEEHVIRTPQPLTTDPADYELPPEDYFGLDWASAPLGHFIRQNITALHDRGLTGAGVTIAVVDRGFHPDHELYGDRVKGHYRAVYDEFGFTTGFEPSPPLPSCHEEIHGLTVASVAAGGTTSDPHLNHGAAPEADLLFIEMLDTSAEGACIDTGISVIQLADFLINEGNPRAKVLNASWGPDHPDLNFDPTYQENVAYTTMREAGILTVAAAGNNVESNNVAIPAVHPDVIAVAAIQDNPLEPVAFTYETEGLNILSVHNFSGYPSHFENNQLRTGMVAGTSVAAPQVTGVIALLLQHNPDLTVDEIQFALEATAHKALDNGKNSLSVGHGVMDALAALQYLENGTIPNHQMSILLDGSPLPVTVRPDGTFLTPYLPNGNYDLTVTTHPQSPIAHWSDTLRVNAASNTPIEDLPQLTFQLTPH